MSSRLLNSRLVAGPCRDEALAVGFETGAAHTRKASNGPAKVFGRFTSRFIQRGTRKHPSSPDKEASRQRKRSWAGSGMPRSMWKYYTEGERAVLCVVGDQVKKHGCCDFPLDRIAAVAGVSRTTCQNALRKARHAELAHVTVEERPRVGQKNLTNIIRIISKDWLGWLKRSIGFKRVSPTVAKEHKTSSLASVDKFQGAYEMVDAEPSQGDHDGRATGKGFDHVDAKRRAFWHGPQRAGAAYDHGPLHGSKVSRAFESC
jgi:hypothetical protein